LRNVIGLAFQGPGMRVAGLLAVPKRAALFDDVSQVAAFDVRQNEDRRLALLQNIVDREYAMLHELGRQLSFLAKAPQTFRILREGWRQAFQGNPALQTLLPGAVDDAHAAVADLIGNAETRDFGQTRVGPLAA